MPVNSIVIAACLEWMDRHTPDPRSLVMPAPNLSVLAPAPRWATLRRAVEVAAVKRSTSGSYPFDRFTLRAKKMLTAAQLEATKAGVSYIGTEHLLLALLTDTDAVATQVLGRFAPATEITDELQAVMASESYNTPGSTPSSA